MSQYHLELAQKNFTPSEVSVLLANYPRFFWGDGNLSNQEFLKKCRQVLQRVPEDLVKYSSEEECVQISPGFELIDIHFAPQHWNHNAGCIIPECYVGTAVHGPSGETITYREASAQEVLDCAKNDGCTVDVESIV